MDTRLAIRATVAAVLLAPLALLIAPAAHAARAVYVGDRGAANIAQFAVDPASGTLSALSPPTVATLPGGLGRLVSVAPNGKWAYLANTGSSATPGTAISQYTVSPTTGALTPMAAPTVASGNGPIGTAVTPDSRFVFAADIRSFAVDPNTGELSPLATYPLSGSLQKLQITPDGRFMYATNYGDSDVHQFAIDRATGALTALSPATVSTGSGFPRPVTIAMSIDAKHLYVGNTAAGNIAQFNINSSTGVLTPMTPATVAAAGPRGLAASADGAKLFVGDGSASGTISTFAIDPSTGALALAGPTIMSAGSTSGVAASGNGRFLYASDGTNGRVSQFAISGSTLTPLAPPQLTAGAGAWGVTLGPNQGPLASMTPSFGSAGQPTTVDASPSTDDTGVASYAWDFGDGSSATTQGATPQHRYATAGTYTASVAVTDDDGCSATPIWAGTTVYCRPGGLATASAAVTVYGTPTITSAPSGTVRANQANVEFTVPAGFAAECRIDGASFGSCTSPLRLAGLADGSHTVDVRSGDGAGHFGAATSRVWTVDGTAPTLAFTEEPVDGTHDSDASVAFVTDDDHAVLTCSLDGAPPSPCSSPAHFTSLADGSHSLIVRAVDAAGNDTAATSSWRRVAAPNTVVTQEPAQGMPSQAATFAFTGDGSVGFECKVDDGPWTSCHSPTTIDAPDGQHTFSVRGLDAVGNADPTPQVRTVVIDRTPPLVRIANGPAATTYTTALAASVTASELSATVSCSLDGALIEDCRTGVARSRLRPGHHVLTVSATDLAGNRSQDVTLGWTIEADFPRPFVRPVGTGNLRCIDRARTSAFVIAHQWLRDHRRVRGAAHDSYAVQTADNRRTLACLTVFRRPSGETVVEAALPVALLGPSRLHGVTFASKVPAAASGSPLWLGFGLTRPGTVLMRIMCRTAAAACPLRSAPPDYRRAVAARATHGLARVDRIVVEGRRGANRLNIRSLFPATTLPPGQYKISMRLRAPSRTGATAALATPLNVPFVVAAG